MLFSQDYSNLPTPGSVSIQQALKAGQNDITIPARIILASGFVTCILFPLLGFSFWSIPICFFGGILNAFLYTLWMTPRWRIWAYSGVRDIHLFQRSAELDRLLPRQSHNKMYGINGIRQREILSGLFERYEEDIPFADDPGVGPASQIFVKSTFSFSSWKNPFVVISDSGIAVRNIGTYSWNEISHEGVVTKSFTSRSYRVAGGKSSSTQDALFFVCPDGHVEIPVSTLSMNASLLDYLLTLHRWRYAQNCASGMQY